MNKFISLRMFVIVMFIMLELVSQLSSRIPTQREHTLCNVKMFNELEKIRQTYDPKSRAFAFWNRSGLLCKTYCRIRSSSRQSTNQIAIYDSPVYEMCGPDRYCSDDGRCLQLYTLAFITNQGMPNSSTTNESTTTKSTTKASTQRTTSRTRSTEPINQSNEDEPTEESNE